MVHGWGVETKRREAAEVPENLLLLSPKLPLIYLLNP